MEDFYLVDWFYGSVLHGGRYATCCESHMNIAIESACLMTDNIWNEGKFLHLFTGHRRC
jgi:hypothetical protein